MNIHKSQLFWGSLGTRVLTHPQMAMAAMGQKDVRPSTSGPPGMEGPLGRLQPRSTGGARSCTLGSEHLGFRKISRKHIETVFLLVILDSENQKHLPQPVQDSENSVRWKNHSLITPKQSISQIISHYLSPFVTQKAFGFRICRWVAEAKILWPADMPDDMLEDAVTGHRRWLGRHYGEVRGSRIQMTDIFINYIIYPDLSRFQYVFSKHPYLSGLFKWDEPPSSTENRAHPSRGATAWQHT